MTAKKRKSRSLSVPRSLPFRTRTQTEPDSSPGPEPVARTPFSAGAVTPIQSLKSVLLSDWWLRRVQGKGLSVAGFETKGGSAVRLFSSAAILKRLDGATLETTDGITVSISGLINRSRTLQNGFSSEVCNHFLLGFPNSWEDYATPRSGQEETAEKHDQTEGRASSFEKASANCSTILFDDVPASRFYDLLMSPTFSGSKDCLKKTLNEVLGRLRHCTAQGNPDKEQSDSRCELSADGINSGGKELKDHSKTLTPSIGVKTRGMLRQNTIQQEKIICKTRSSTRTRSQS